MEWLSSLPLLFQGAESVSPYIPFVNSLSLLQKVYEGEYLGYPCIWKWRFPKKYRHPELDIKLTKQRIRTEVKSILKAKQFNIEAPIILAAVLDQGLICFKKIEGQSLADFLVVESNCDLDTIGMALGGLISKLHNQASIIHGDLTTNNVMISFEEADDDKSFLSSSLKLTLIDFGLASTSNMVEDKAVDLYVLERALQSGHPNHADQLNAAILKGYCSTEEDIIRATSKDVITKLEAVRARGRKKTCF